MVSAKIGMAVFSIAVLSGALMAQRGIAYAQEQMICEPTLENLPDCVTHHYENGQIHSKALYRLLLFEANLALHFHEQGRDAAAIKVLNVFIIQVQKASPTLIDPEAAEHMIRHAKAAIQQLAPA